MRAVHQHRPQGNGQVVTMMRTTVSTQPQIIIVVAVSRSAAAPTARGATIPCMVLTAKRPRILPSSGTCATVVTTTTAKRASTTSRAATTTLPTAGSSTRIPSPPPTSTASSAPICSHIARIIRSCGRMNPASFLLK